MKNSVSVQRQVLVSYSAGTGSAPFVEAMPNRRVLIISSPAIASNNLTLSLEQTAVDGAGIILFPTNDPLILTYESHGDLVTRAWSAIATVADEEISVIETFVNG